jgi:hypothetical protein
LSNIHQRAHDALLQEIEAEVRDTQDRTGRASLSERVIQALRRVPREAFVPAHLQDAAYQNMPLSIGHRQTISQPYIVALMTELLEPQADHVVLEVGTGSATRRPSWMDSSSMCTRSRWFPPWPKKQRSGCNVWAITTLACAKAMAAWAGPRTCPLRRRHRDGRRPSGAHSAH